MKGKVEYNKQREKEPAVQFGPLLNMEAGKDLICHLREISSETPSCTLLTNSGTRLEVKTFFVTFSFIVISFFAFQFFCFFCSQVQPFLLAAASPFLASLLSQVVP